MSLEKIHKYEMKDRWISDLREFIVIANKNTYASGTGIIPQDLVQRPGYKELEYIDGLWKMRDSYTGYYRAPGVTTVYYKGIPSWVMTYMGRGMLDGFYNITKETFIFLKSALMKVDPSLPFRGPSEYIEGDFRYNFNILSGDILDGMWREEIFNKDDLVFTQTGLVGVVIPKNDVGDPLNPWDL